MTRACLALASLGITTTAAAQVPKPKFPGEPPPVVGRSADPALAPVPTDSFGFVSLKASKLWDLPAAKPLPARSVGRMTRSARFTARTPRTARVSRT